MAKRKAKPKEQHIKIRLTRAEDSSPVSIGLEPPIPFGVDGHTPEFEALVQAAKVFANQLIDLQVL